MYKNVVKFISLKYSIFAFIFKFNAWEAIVDPV